MSPIGMTLVLLTTLGFFSWSAKRRVRQLKVGVPDPDFDLSRPGELFDRVKTLTIYAFFQKKMPNYSIAGFAHVGIFMAFQVLLLNSIMLWGRGFDPTFDFWGLLSTDHIVGQGYSLIKELAAGAAVLGACAFWYIRLVKKGVDHGDPKYSQRGARMTLGNEPNVILGIIFTMMVADFLYVGASVAIQHAAEGTPVHWTWYEPIGSVLALIFSGMDVGQAPLTVLQHVGFWWHSAFVLIFLNILPFSKHFHIITVIPNVFAYQRRHNALPKVEDLEGKVEREESLGINQISDLTYKGILDLYTCTECGRCSDNCPAFITNKKLSPKHLTLALRNHLYDTEEAMFGKGDTVTDPKDDAAPAPSDDVVEMHGNPPPPEGAYFESSQVVDLVPNILHPDVIWACTSCRACEEQCPVMITYVDKIIGMRREEVMMKNEFPAQLQTAFNGIETNGNPWNISAMDRADWADGLDVPLMSDTPDAEVLYWVGCA
ncbi:MAG: (Fe-S)-binding protein, partial [Myxococcales bacterium]|nr:(Fe-S)-binding protein [Myxococcales bacterium]